MIKPAKLTKLSIAALVGSIVLFSHTQPADAAIWPAVDDYLGRLTAKDNEAYARAQGKMALPQPPANRDKLCQWKYGNKNVWGQTVSSTSFDTNCYRWRWFWQ